ncbi:hypothetical protein MYCTH_2130506 [Thermothelomyces thermophilus ATCC 42464]|uniref:Uncharacterized protein n=1 Tax=Thermothelomyces thermophilus (strain ATCC 42464 / BCRC 31852 / DSM 1799) TaxID=573729 RepID=G2QP19_THET4|nr:uncharacterized protein MYCTH_2130506 [Thermothelomyces thermophilus ATCC 42464]AEO61340.1 hypothetical protein MYCTH_2130506 [Thermothelomyces thermophilus ATCC 42464]
MAFCLRARPGRLPMGERVRRELMRSVDHAPAVAVAVRVVATLPVGGDPGSSRYRVTNPKLGRGGLAEVVHRVDLERATPGAGASSGSRKNRHSHLVVGRISGPKGGGGAMAVGHGAAPFIVASQERTWFEETRAASPSCFEWREEGAVSREFYVAGLEEHVYGCRDNYFSDITIASTTTTTTTASRMSRPTGSPDEEGSGPTTTSGAAPEPTGRPDGAAHRAAPVLLAAGGLVAVLLV